VLRDKEYRTDKFAEVGLDCSLPGFIAGRSYDTNAIAGQWWRMEYVRGGLEWLWRCFFLPNKDEAIATSATQVVQLCK